MKGIFKALGRIAVVGAAAAAGYFFALGQQDKGNTELQSEEDKTEKAKEEKLITEDNEND